MPIETKLKTKLKTKVQAETKLEREYRIFLHLTDRKIVHAYLRRRKAARAIKTIRKSRLRALRGAGSKYFAPAFRHPHLYSRHLATNRRGVVSARWLALVQRNKYSAVNLFARWTRERTLQTSKFGKIARLVKKHRRTTLLSNLAPAIHKTAPKRLTKYFRSLKFTNLGKRLSTRRAYLSRTLTVNSRRATMQLCDSNARMRAKTRRERQFTTNILKRNTPLVLIRRGRAVRPDEAFNWLFEPTREGNPTPKRSVIYARVDPSAARFKRLLFDYSDVNPLKPIPWGLMAQQWRKLRAIRGTRLSNLPLKSMVNRLSNRSKFRPTPAQHAFRYYRYSEPARGARALRARNRRLLRVERTFSPTPSRQTSIASNAGRVKSGRPVLHLDSGRSNLSADEQYINRMNKVVYALRARVGDIERFRTIYDLLALARTDASRFFEHTLLPHSITTNAASRPRLLSTPRRWVRRANRTRRGATLPSMLPTPQRRTLLRSYRRGLRARQHSNRSITAYFEAEKLALPPRSRNILTRRQRRTFAKEVRRRRSLTKRQKRKLKLAQARAVVKPALPYTSRSSVHTAKLVAWKLPLTHATKVNSQQRLAAIELLSRTFVRLQRKYQIAATRMPSSARLQQDANRVTLRLLLLTVGRPFRRALFEGNTVAAAALDALLRDLRSAFRQGADISRRRLSQLFLKILVQSKVMNPSEHKAILVLLYSWTQRTARMVERKTEQSINSNVTVNARAARTLRRKRATISASRALFSRRVCGGVRSLQQVLNRKTRARHRLRGLLRKRVKKVRKLKRRPTLPIKVKKVRKLKGRPTLRTKVKRLSRVGRRAIMRRIVKRSKRIKLLTKRKASVRKGLWALLRARLHPSLRATKHRNGGRRKSMSNIITVAAPDPLVSRYKARSLPRLLRRKNSTGRKVRRLRKMAFTRSLQFKARIRRRTVRARSAQFSAHKLRQDSHTLTRLEQRLAAFTRPRLSATRTRRIRPTVKSIRTRLQQLSQTVQRLLEGARPTVRAVLSSTRHNQKQRRLYNTVSDEKPAPFRRTYVSNRAATLQYQPPVITDSVITTQSGVTYHAVAIPHNSRLPRALYSRRAPRSRLRGRYAHRNQRVIGDKVQRFLYRKYIPRFIRDKRQIIRLAQKRLLAKRGAGVLLRAGKTKLKLVGRRFRLKHVIRQHLCTRLSRFALRRRRRFRSRRAFTPKRRHYFVSHKFVSHVSGRKTVRIRRWRKSALKRLVSKKRHWIGVKFRRRIRRSTGRVIPALTRFTQPAYDRGSRRETVRAQQLLARHAAAFKRLLRQFDAAFSSGKWNQRAAQPLAHSTTPRVLQLAARTYDKHLQPPSVQSVPAPRIGSFLIARRRVNTRLQRRSRRVKTGYGTMLDRRFNRANGSLDFFCSSLISHKRRSSAFWNARQADDAALKRSEIKKIAPRAKVYSELIHTPHSSPFAHNEVTLPAATSPSRRPFTKAARKPKQQKAILPQRKSVTFKVVRRKTGLFRRYKRTASGRREGRTQLLKRAKKYTGVLLSGFIARSPNAVKIKQLLLLKKLLKGNKFNKLSELAKLNRLGEYTMLGNLEKLAALDLFTNETKQRLTFKLVKDIAALHEADRIGSRNHALRTRRPIRFKKTLLLSIVRKKRSARVRRQAGADKKFFIFNPPVKGRRDTPRKLTAVSRTKRSAVTRARKTLRRTKPVKTYLGTRRARKTFALYARPYNTDSLQLVTRPPAAPAAPMVLTIGKTQRVQPATLRPRFKASRRPRRALKKSGRRYLSFATREGIRRVRLRRARGSARKSIRTRRLITMAQMTNYYSVVLTAATVPSNYGQRAHLRNSQGPNALLHPHPLRTERSFKPFTRVRPWATKIHTTPRLLCSDSGRYSELEQAFLVDTNGKQAAPLFIHTQGLPVQFWKAAYTALPPTESTLSKPDKSAPTLKGRKGLNRAEGLKLPTPEEPIKKQPTSWRIRGLDRSVYDKTLFNTLTAFVKLSDSEKQGAVGYELLCHGYKTALSARERNAAITPAWFRLNLVVLQYVLTPFCSINVDNPAAALLPWRELPRNKQQPAVKVIAPMAPVSAPTPAVAQISADAPVPAGELSRADVDKMNHAKARQGLIRYLTLPPEKQLSEEGYTVVRIAYRNARTFSENEGGFEKYYYDVIATIKAMRHYGYELAVKNPTKIAEKFSQTPRQRK